MIESTTRKRECNEEKSAEIKTSFRQYDNSAFHVVEFTIQYIIQKVCSGYLHIWDVYSAVLVNDYLGLISCNFQALSYAISPSSTISRIISTNNS